MMLPLEQEMYANLKVLKRCVDTLRELDNVVVKKKEVSREAQGDELRKRFSEAVRGWSPDVLDGNSQFGPSIVDRWWFINTFLLNVMEKLIDQLKSLNEIPSLKQESRQVLEEKPKPPPGLLSLQHYVTVQAVAELVVCWGMYSCLPERNVLPINQRKLSKALKLSTVALSMWLPMQESDASSEVRASQLNRCTFVLGSMLRLEQFKALLLPSYLVDLSVAAMHVQFDPTALKEQFDSCNLLTNLMEDVPPRLCISSLRAALGRVKGEKWFNECCGRLLTQQVLRNGGVQGAIEVLLGSFQDGGDTQLQLRVANLIALCPQSCSLDDYLASIGPQLLELLDVGATLDTLLARMAVLIVDKMILVYPTYVDKYVLFPICQPLLVVDRPYLVAEQDTKGDVLMQEEHVERCIARISTIIQCPSIHRTTYLALLPCVRPLIHLYHFAMASKSFLKSTTETLLLELIPRLPSSTAMILCSVLNEPMQLRQTLHLVPETPCRSERSKFAPGGSGGIAIKKDFANCCHQTTSVNGNEEVMHSLLKLFDSKPIQETSLVGDLFVVLLNLFVDIRQGTNSFESKIDGTADVLEGQLAFYKIDATDGKHASCALQFLASMSESLGPAILKNATQILSAIILVLKAFVSDDTNGFAEADDDILSLCLGLLNAIVEFGSSTRESGEENLIQSSLDSLGMLSRHSSPHIADMACSLKVSLLSRGAATATPSVEDFNGKTIKRQPQEIIRDAKEDLKSDLVPLKARGLVQLTKLVRSSANQKGLAKPDYILELMKVYLDHLLDAESYVYLAAVQGLATLADFHPIPIIPLLVKHLKDVGLPIEQRIKLAEALMFTARRCGEILPVYANLFVYAYLTCIRPVSLSKPTRGHQASSLEVKQDAPKLVEELNLSSRNADLEVEEFMQRNKSGSVQKKNEHPLNNKDDYASAVLRSSCLSNLAEVCSLLNWAIHPFVNDVVGIAVGVLEFERGHAPMEVATRRGAVYLLFCLIEKLQDNILQIMPDQMSKIFRVLKQVRDQPGDEVTKYHAEQGLRSLDDLMRSQFLSDAVGQSRIFDITPSST